MDNIDIHKSIPGPSSIDLLPWQNPEPFYFANLIEADRQDQSPCRVDEAEAQIETPSQYITVEPTIEENSGPVTLEEMNDNKLVSQRIPRAMADGTKAASKWILGYAVSSYSEMPLYDAGLQESVFGSWIPENQRRSLGNTPNPTTLNRLAAPLQTANSAFMIWYYGTGLWGDYQQTEMMLSDGLDGEEWSYAGYLAGDALNMGASVAEKATVASGALMAARPAASALSFGLSVGFNLIGTLGSLFGNTLLIGLEMAKPAAQRNTAQMQNSISFLCNSLPDLVKVGVALKQGITALKSGEYDKARQIFQYLFPKTPGIQKLLTSACLLSYVLSLYSFLQNLIGFAEAAKQFQEVKMSYYGWGMLSSATMFLATVCMGTVGLTPVGLLLQVFSQAMLMQQVKIKQDGGKTDSPMRYFQMQELTNDYGLQVLNAHRARTGLPPLSNDELNNLFTLVGLNDQYQENDFERQISHIVPHAASQLLRRWCLATPERRATVEFKQEFMKSVDTYLNPSLAGGTYLRDPRARAAFLLFLEPLLTDVNFPDADLGYYTSTKFLAREILNSEDAQLVRESVFGFDARSDQYLLVYLKAHPVKNQEQLLHTVSNLEGDLSFAGLGGKVQTMLSEAAADMQSGQLAEMVWSDEDLRTMQNQISQEQMDQIDAELVNLSGLERKLTAY